MASIRVIIRDVTGRGSHQAELPHDVPMRRLIPALLTRLNLPILSPDGQPISYHLYHDVRRVGQEETLDEVGIREGDELKISQEAVAGCFPAGTPIVLPDGTRISIEALKIGQRVLSLDPATSEACGSTVSAITVQVADHLLIINTSLRITRTHPVYSEGRWLPAGNLKIGDKLLCADGSSACVSSLEITQAPVTVYNLHLNPPTHTFFAGEILVHNAYLKEFWNGTLNRELRASSYIQVSPSSEDEGRVEWLDRSIDPGGLHFPETARRSFVRHFLLSDKVREKFALLFSTRSQRVSWRMRLTETRPAIASDYGVLFTSLDRLYTIFLTVVRPEEFLRVWIRGLEPAVPPGEEFSIRRIQKSSPLEIQGIGLSEAVKALGDTLSIGKQIEDIRKIGIRVAEARLELKRKELQLRTEERVAAEAEAFEDLDREIQREKRLLELEELRERRRELERQHEALVWKQLNERFALLRNWINVLDELPVELRAGLKRALFSQVKTIYSSCFEVTELIIEDYDETRYSEEISNQ